MIAGLGTDIVEIARIESLLQKSGEQFLTRIYHSSEIEQYESISNEKKKIAYLAKRFAGKEAFAKALGTGIKGGVNFNQIAILNNELGKPYIQLHNHPEINGQFHISLSDETHYAIATVIIEG